MKITWNEIELTISGIIRSWWSFSIGEYLCNEIFVSKLRVLEINLYPFALKSRIFEKIGLNEKV